MPQAYVTALGDLVQPPDVVARSVIVLMADGKRHGECVYSEKGKFWEMENGEKGIHRKIQELMVGADVDGSLSVVTKARAAVMEAKVSAGRQ